MDRNAASAQQTSDDRGQTHLIPSTRAASDDDELHFVLGWRYIRTGQIVSQGVVNHTTSADQLPQEFRAALLDWLTHPG
jgi:hypothetical protein